MDVTFNCGDLPNPKQFINDRHSYSLSFAAKLSRILLAANSFPALAIFKTDERALCDRSPRVGLAELEPEGMLVVEVVVEVVLAAEVVVEVNRVGKGVVVSEGWFTLNRT